MTVQLNTTGRSNMLDQIEATAGATALMRLFTGAQPANCAAADSGTNVAEGALPADWMAAVGLFDLTQWSQGWVTEEYAPQATIGALSATLGAATLNGVGTAAVVGTSAPSLADATLGGAGAVAASAVLAAILADVTLSATGTVFSPGAGPTVRSHRRRRLARR